MLLQKDLIPIIESNLDNMTSAEKEVAHYFLQQEPIMDNMTTTNFCKKIHVSKATLTRFSQKCGFAGFREFFFQYKEMMNEKSQVTFHRDLTKQVLSDYEEMLSKNYSIIDENQLERITKIIESVECIYLYGKGSSELALRELKMRFMRLGIKGEVFSDEDMIWWNNLLVDEKCLVIGASISGKTKPVIEALKTASQNGAKTVLMTTKKIDNAFEFVDELLLLPSTQYLSYGNRISPQFPILLMTDCLFAYYLDNPSRKYYYDQTIIHKED